MKSWESKILGKAWTPRRLAAVLLLLLFLGLTALAQSESLHRALHPDAGASHHQCAVTLLRSGHTEAPECVVVVAPMRAVVETSSIPAFRDTSSPDYSLPPSCGPPALLS